MGKDEGRKGGRERGKEGGRERVMMQILDLCSLRYFSTMALWSVPARNLLSLR